MQQALIIGAGITGLTAARSLAEHGFQVTVLEKRDHIGGNAFDYCDNGVLVHKYGPHLFCSAFLILFHTVTGCLGKSTADWCRSRLISGALICCFRKGKHSI